jgi:RNA polymerase sigma-70 factor (ECF subfamily)
LKQLRTSSREAAVDEFDDDYFVSVEKQPINHLLDGELAGKVQQAVSSLPPLQREALVLFEYEGLTLNEIAELLGTDAGAVKSRLFRARERLRMVLSPYLTSSSQLNTKPEIVTLERS